MHHFCDFLMQADRLGRSADCLPINKKNEITIRFMTKTFKKSTNGATRSKWARLCHGAGWVSSSKYLEVGFSSWFLKKDDNGDFLIEASTTYHAETTLDAMYRSNFKKW